MMAEHLRAIVRDRLTKATFQAHFIGEVVDLLCDCDVQVALEAMEVCVECMQKGFFSDEQFEEDVFPSFMRIFETEVDDHSDVQTSAILGRFIHYLPIDTLRTDKVY